MKNFLALVAIFILNGCATPDYNYRAELSEISEPALNSINTAYVGDTLLKQGRYSEHDAIYLSNMTEVSWYYDLHPGYYLKQGEDDNSETYLPSNQPDGGHVVKAALADDWLAIMVYKNKPTICVITVFNASVCNDNANFQRTKKPILTSNSFQQTLIYSGKVGNKINIGYRELSNNVARPAFNNDVEYDLDASNIIGYKGSKIEVIEANNEMIKYKVLKNFNEAKY